MFWVSKQYKMKCVRCGFCTNTGTTNRVNALKICRKAGWVVRRSGECVCPRCGY